MANVNYPTNISSKQPYVSKWNKKNGGYNS